MSGSLFVEGTYTPKFKLTRAGRARLMAHIRYHYAAKTDAGNPRQISNVELSQFATDAERTMLHNWETQDEAHDDYRDIVLTTDRVRDMTINGSWFLQAHWTRSGQMEAIHFAAYEFELATSPSSQNRLTR